MPETVGRVPENEKVSIKSLRTYMSDWLRVQKGVVAYAEGKGLNTERSKMDLEGLQRTINMMDSLGMLDKELPEAVWAVAFDTLPETFGQTYSDRVIKDGAKFLSVLTSLNQLAK